MISSRNLAALPDARVLQHRCRSLAVLEAMLSPAWEYRFYSYYSDWSEHEECFQMRDGSGNEMLILFRAEGCAINGFRHEYPQPPKAELIRGLPEAYHEFILGEPVATTGTTFCLWYTHGKGWRTGQLSSEDDGSDELLYIFDGDPTTYVNWAKEYYEPAEGEIEFGLDAVARIYRGELLTQEVVLALVEEVEDWPALAAELDKIGYPHSLS